MFLEMFVSFCFPLSFGLTSLFTLSLSIYLSLSLSLSISLFLCLSLALFCLPSFFSCFFAFFSFLVLLSLFFAFFAFVSGKEQHQNIKFERVFHQFFLFLMSCLVFSFNSLFLIFVFLPDFMLCFCSTSLLLGLKRQVETNQFWVKRGCNKTFSFNNLCFAKCEKLSFLVWLFLGKIWLIIKNIVNTCISEHFESKKSKKHYHF